MMAKPVRALELHYPMIQVQLWYHISHLKCYIWTLALKKVPPLGYFREWAPSNNVAASLEFQLNWSAHNYPGPRGFSWFFLAKEIKSKPRSGDNESQKRWGEREKPLVTLASNLTFMQTTAVKHVKLLIKRVTNGNLANTYLSAAIFLSGGRPGEIMLWTNHLH